MKKINMLLVLILSISLFGIGCTKGGSAGADSPEDLFTKIKGFEQGNMGAITDLVAPDELPLIAFSLDSASAMMSLFSKDKSVAGEIKSLREKYKLPDLSKAKINLSDPKSVEEFANKNYSDIDMKGFIIDIEKVIDASSNKSKDTSKALYTELKDIKTEGDKATGTVILADKSTRKITFRNIEGNWFLSIKDQMMK